MDLWYELAIREMGDLNEEVTELLEEAEALLVTADDEDEEGE
jgi:ribosomal protein L11 methylase PrmA